MLFVVCCCVLCCFIYGVCFPSFFCLVIDDCFMLRVVYCVGFGDWSLLLLVVVCFVLFVACVLLVVRR